MLSKYLLKIKLLWGMLKHINRYQDSVKINQGKILALLNNSQNYQNLSEYNFKVFSKFGEDGIIQYLIENIEIKNKTFIEFGVESYLESNTRFLMMNNNWDGYVLDSDEKNITSIKNSYFYETHNLLAHKAFITKENINNLMSLSQFDQDLGILSIDIDGNDFYVFEEIKVFKPRIIICEFNNLFGLREIVIPYREDFDRFKAHYSGCYQGASITALNLVASNKGYSLVGIDNSGTNAFFVRNDLLNSNLRAVKPEDVYFPYKIRSSFNQNGNYYVNDSFEEKRNHIKGMPILNIKTNTIEKF